MNNSPKTKGTPFESSFIYTLKFETIGKYRFYFHSLIYCNMDSECKNAKDFISINQINDSARKSIGSVVSLSSPNEENKWIENYFEFDVKENDEIKEVRTLFNVLNKIISLIKS